MLDSIDKQEYIDNSKVFFDFLMHTRQWSNISQVEYKKWLSNFDGIPDGAYIACRLLNHLIYYSEKDTIKLIVESIDNIFSQEIVLPLQLSKGFSSLPSENEFEIAEAIKRTLIVPLTLFSDPGDSGPHIMRLIHNHYKPRMQSCFSHLINATMNVNYDRLIIVDDFVGSGKQFSEFWTESEIKGGQLLRNWCAENGIKAYYLALIGYEDTLHTLRSTFTDISIIFSEALTGYHRVFSDNSFCWSDKDEQNQVRQILEEELEKYGIKLLGFDGLDFAVATNDTIPDWSLPLFHKNINGWRMLVERKDSNE